MPTAPDATSLKAVVDRFGHVIASGECVQTKALFVTLVDELRVNIRSEILRTDGVGAPVVCAPNGSVELVGLEPTTSSLPATRSPS